MSLFGATTLNAFATLALAIFALVAAILAGLAFRRQSQEVQAIEGQVGGMQELTRQQGDLIKIQARQLEALQGQLEEQRKAGDAQAQVLALQAAELQESLKERKRQAELGRGDQARRVFLTEGRFGGRKARGQAGNVPAPGAAPPSVTAIVYNTSAQPIYDAQLRWHDGPAGLEDPEPELVGTVLPGAEHPSRREFPPGTDLDSCWAVLRFRDAAGTAWERKPDGGLAEQPVAGELVASRDSEPSQELPAAAFQGRMPWTSRRPSCRERRTRTAALARPSAFGAAPATLAGSLSMRLRAAEDGELESQRTWRPVAFRAKAAPWRLHPP